jgi:hypothetical protein
MATGILIYTGMALMLNAPYFDKLALASNSQEHPSGNDKRS